MNISRILTVGTLAALLASCQAVSYNPRPISVQPQGIEGQWTDPNGIISSFSNGRFETRTTDTNSLLAEGILPLCLQPDGRDRVDLAVAADQFKGQLRPCFSQSQLNCTSSTGAQFTLVRRI
jgi:hypothetical protein